METALTGDNNVGAGGTAADGPGVALSGVMTLDTTGALGAEGAPQAATVITKRAAKTPPVVRLTMFCRSLFWIPTGRPRVSVPDDRWPAKPACRRQRRRPIRR